jgi:hypothetical protein
MGYTHYFRRDKRNVGSAWMFGNLALDAKKIIEQAKSEGIEICGPMGTGEPEFTEAHFAFNGTQVNGFDHETFWWEALPEQPEWQTKHFAKSDEKNDIFDFCKTAYKPYDAVVTAVLIRAKHWYGELVKIGSDGDWDGDWQEGRALYERVFGEVGQCPKEKVSA